MCDNKFINNTNNLQMANYRLWNFTFLKIHPVYIKENTETFPSKMADIS